MTQSSSQYSIVTEKCLEGKNEFIKRLQTNKEKQTYANKGRLTFNGQLKYSYKLSVRMTKLLDFILYIDIGTHFKTDT